MSSHDPEYSNYKKNFFDKLDGKEQKASKSLLTSYAKILPELQGNAQGFDALHERLHGIYVEPLLESLDKEYMPMPLQRIGIMNDYKLRVFIKGIKNLNENPDKIKNPKRICEIVNQHLIDWVIPHFEKTSEEHSGHHPTKQALPRYRYLTLYIALEAMARHLAQQFMLTEDEIAQYQYCTYSKRCADKALKRANKIKVTTDELRHLRDGSKKLGETDASDFALLAVYSKRIHDLQDEAENPNTEDEDVLKGLIEKLRLSDDKHASDRDTASKIKGAIERLGKLPKAELGKTGRGYRGERRLYMWGKPLYEAVKKVHKDFPEDLTQNTKRGSRDGDPLISVYLAPLPDAGTSGKDLPPHTYSRVKTLYLLNLAYGQHCPVIFDAFRFTDENIDITVPEALKPFWEAAEDLS